MTKKRKQTLIFACGGEKCLHHTRRPQILFGVTRFIRSK